MMGSPGPRMGGESPLGVLLTESPLVVGRLIVAVVDEVGVVVVCLLGGSRLRQ